MSTETTTPPEKVNEKEGSLSTYSGEALPLSETYHLSSEEPTKLVCLIGIADAGKSTLITRMFDLFQDGPIGDLIFSNSYTMLGFERILHPHRIRLSEGYSKTDRTTRMIDPDTLHLKIMNKFTKEYSNFLITNTSGEILKDLIKTQDSATDVSYLKRANVVAFTLNAKNFTSKALIEEEVRSVRIVIDRLIKADLLSTSSVFQIIYTKCDSYSLPQTDLALKQYVDSQVQTNISNLLKNNGFNPPELLIETQSQPFADINGHAEVLLSWTKQKKEDDLSTDDSKQKTSDRQFDNFMQQNGDSNG